MGKFSTPKAPTPPDPREIAQTDAEFNRIDQFTPFGNLTFSGPNRNISTLEFSPEIQDLFNQRQQVDSNLLSNALGRQGALQNDVINIDEFGNIQSEIDQGKISFDSPTFGDLPALDSPDIQGLDPSLLDLEGLRTRTEDAVFNRGRRLLEPQFERSGRNLIQGLATQGLPRAGEAASRERQDFLDSENRAFADLADRSVLQGGQEVSRLLGDAIGAQGFNNQAGLLGLGAQQGIRGQLFGEGLQGAAANNQASAQNLGLQQQLLQNRNAARTQSLNEQLGIRGNQFNELASLLGLQQVQAPTQQSFFAPGQADVLGGFGLNQAAQQNAFNAQLQQQQGALGGLFGLGSALITGGGSHAGGIPGLFGF